MRSPEKSVSQEDMWKVLEKHGGTRPKAGQSPKEKSAIALPPLEWDKPVKTGDNAGYVLTLCGRYSVSKDSVFGRAMYSAWRRHTPEMPDHLGIRDTLAEAQHLCELNRK
jgi:hypothetical protein